MEQSVVFAQIGNSCIPRRGQPYVEAAITETARVIRLRPTPEETILQDFIPEAL